MRRFWKRGGLRLVGLLALVALLQPLPSSVLFGDDAGRTFSRCVQLCNTLRGICEANCQATCTAMFPGGGSEFNACIHACFDTCAAPSQACKKQCLSDKAAVCRGNEL